MSPVKLCDKSRKCSMLWGGKVIMNNKQAILNVNVEQDFADRSKIDVVKNLISEDRKVWLIGAGAENFQQTHFPENDDLVKVYSKEQGLALTELYRDTIHPYKSKEAEFFILPGEYPLFRFLVEKMFSEAHTATYTVVPSGLQGVFYEELIQSQQKLMSKYIEQLDSVENPDVGEVHALLTR